MSKTIEMSRELAENLLHCGDTASTITPYVTAQLRAILAAPVVERQPDYYRILTPRVSIGGEVTEWWPACMLYTKAQVDELVGPYKIEERLYTSPPAPVSVAAASAEKKQISDQQAIIEKLSCRRDKAVRIARQLRDSKRYLERQMYKALNEQCRAEIAIPYNETAECFNDKC